MYYFITESSVLCKYFAVMWQFLHHGALATRVSKRFQNTQRRRRYESRRAAEKSATGLEANSWCHYCVPFLESSIWAVACLPISNISQGYGLGVKWLSGGGRSGMRRGGVYRVASARLRGPIWHIRHRAPPVQQLVLNVYKYLVPLPRHTLKNTKHTAEPNF